MSRLGMRTGPTTLLLAGALLAGCSGATSAGGQVGSGSASEAPSVSTITSSSPGPPTAPPHSTAAGIPDGTWTRVITTAEIARRGLVLPAEELTGNYLDDGTVQVVIKTQG